MKLIYSSAEYLPQQPGIEGIYKQIELAGRTSYLSWDKTTEDSAKKFVDMLIKSKHTSVLEHGAVYLKIPVKLWSAEEHEFRFMFPEGNQYFIEDCDGKYFYISTNLRYILEQNVGLQSIVEFGCQPEKYHEKRLSVKVICSRGISHELVRHRAMSFIQESQRYIGYNKDKFGGEITYIIPSWLNYIQEGSYTLEDIRQPYFRVPFNYPPEVIPFMHPLAQLEATYMSLINDFKCKPQEARDILPNATKTTLVITAFESDWRQFFDQRLFGKTGEPHPDMKILAEQIKEKFEINNLWDSIMKYPSKYE